MSRIWPQVQVSGRLESAEAEWLHTNGAGAYSMSTVAMRHTRRYHGLLVAALNPPVDRFVIMSHLETTVFVGGRPHRLTIHQSPGAAPTPGYRFLEAFAQDPTPRWTYRLGRVRFEQSLALCRGQNAVVVSHTWHGPQPVRLVVRPLMAMRRIHALMHEHGAMVQRVRLRPGEVEMRPVPGLPSVLFRHEGTFMGSPDWYRRLEYPEDKLRKVEAEEDLWTPGSFELSLVPGVASHLVVGVGELPGEEARVISANTAAWLLGQDPGEDHPSSVRVLSIAADQFCADDCEHPSVIAGYPWLSALSRDSLIALPGLYLTRGRLDGARGVLRTIARAMRDGLVPRRVLQTGRSAEPFSADATLWLFEATRHLVSVTGPDDEVVREVLYPAMAQAFERILGAERRVLWLGEDDLVEADDDDVALMWLDARTGATLATPRRGFTVELQALFTRGTETLATLAEHSGDLGLATRAREARARVRTAFRERFWCEAARYPYDRLTNPDHQDGHISDSAIRPNALVALDVDPDLFEKWQAVSILERVRERLLTVRGIRSLDPRQPGYRGEYGGSFEERRLLHHQGLAWTHLLGAYARASLRVSPDDFDLEEDLRVRIEEANADGPVLGQVSQFSDGEPPHRPGGCPAQATSVAELLRTLVWDLRL